VSRHFDNLDAILEFDALDVTVCQLAKGFALDIPSSRRLREGGE